MLGKRDFAKAQVKDKSAAPMQITAEQLLREAVDRERAEKGPPKITFANEAELNDYRLGKRKEFEDSLRLKRNNIGIWLRYAKWETDQQEFRRARSIYERTLQVDYQNISVWNKYIDMEISNKFIQHARNLYDRVTSLLPRVDQFWLNYAYMEERLENYAGARGIYEKWMSWKPSENSWLQYIKFEERCGEIGRARAVFERYIQQYQDVTCFIRYCRFEDMNREFEKARAGYETCVNLIDNLNEDIFIKYAQFEVRRGEIEKANRVYRLGLEKLDSKSCKKLYNFFVSHTKQTGTRSEIDQILLDKRRAHYERLVAEQPQNLDHCFLYILTEEEAGEIDRARELYERFIAYIPQTGDKKFWKRYIYLWLFYAQFEEVKSKDIARCRQIYETVVELMNISQIFFAKIFREFGKFEIRQSNLSGFRKVMSAGLNLSHGHKPSIARFWLETELRIGQVSQARFAAAKMVEINPNSANSWISFADLELAFGETDRAVAICQMGLKAAVSDSPESIFKKLIDIETLNENFDAVRELFKEMISNSDHYKVFLEYANFEANTVGAISRACAILEEALEIVPDSHVSQRKVLRSRLDELIEQMNGADKIDNDM
jgi:crooked neck